MVVAPIFNVSGLTTAGSVEVVADEEGRDVRQELSSDIAPAMRRKNAIFLKWKLKSLVCIIRESGNRDTFMFRDA